MGTFATTFSVVGSTMASAFSDLFRTKRAGDGVWATEHEARMKKRMEARIMIFFMGAPMVRQSQ